MNDKELDIIGFKLLYYVVNMRFIWVFPLKEKPISMSVMHYVPIFTSCHIPSPYFCLELTTFEQIKSKIAHMPVAYIQLNAQSKHQVINFITPQVAIQLIMQNAIYITITTTNARILIQ